MQETFHLGEQQLVAFIATRDPDRARKFYGETLKFRLVSEELPFALVFDAKGTMLRVTVVRRDEASGLHRAWLANTEHHRGDERTSAKWNPIRTIRGHAARRIRRLDGAQRCQNSLVQRPGRQRVEHFTSPLAYAPSGLEFRTRHDCSELPRVRGMPRTSRVRAFAPRLPRYRGRSATPRPLPAVESSQR